MKRMINDRGKMMRNSWKAMTFMTSKNEGRKHVLTNTVLSDDKIDDDSYATKWGHIQIHFLT